MGKPVPLTVVHRERMLCGSVDAAKSEVHADPGPGLGLTSSMGPLALLAGWRTDLHPDSCSASSDCVP